MATIGAVAIPVVFYFLLFEVSPLKEASRPKKLALLAAATCFEIAYIYFFWTL